MRWAHRFFVAGVMAAATQATAARLDILIEDLHSGAGQCGITESNLESRARLTLRGAGITADKDAVPYLYVRLTTLALPSGCVSNINVTIQEQATLRQNASFIPVRKPSYPVCASGTLITGPQHDFVDRVMNSIEQAIKDCLGKVLYK